MSLILTKIFPSDIAIIIKRYTHVNTANTIFFGGGYYGNIGNPLKSNELWSFTPEQNYWVCYMDIPLNICDKEESEKDYSSNKDDNDKNNKDDKDNKDKNNQNNNDNKDGDDNKNGDDNKDGDDKSSKNNKNSKDDKGGNNKSSKNNDGNDDDDDMRGYFIIIGDKIPKSLSILNICVCEDQIYILCDAHFLCLDLITEKWKNLAFPKIARSDGQLIQVGHYIYLIGGDEIPDPCKSHGIYKNLCRTTNMVERYDIENNAWKFISNLNIPRRNFGCVYYANRLMVFGGVNDLYMKFLLKPHKEIPILEGLYNRHHGGQEYKFISPEIPSHNNLESIEVYDLNRSPLYALWGKCEGLNDSSDIDKKIFGEMSAAIVKNDDGKIVVWAVENDYDLERKHTMEYDGLEWKIANDVVLKDLPTIKANNHHAETNFRNVAQICTPPSNLRCMYIRWCNGDLLFYDMDTKTLDKIKLPPTFLAERSAILATRTFQNYSRYYRAS